MLLLVTLALVVASAVLLVLGFVQDALGFIYVSMLCAGVAALALFVFARLARRRGAALAGADIGSSPYREVSRSGGGASAGEGPGRAEPDAGEFAAFSPSADGEKVESWYDEDAGEDQDVDSGATAGGAVAAAAVGQRAAEPEGPWTPAGANDEDWGDEVVFPIEDYDDLRVAEILPLLSQLDPDELQEVRDRELAGKARATILDRIDDRLGRVAGPPPSTVTTAALPVVEPAGTDESAAPGAPAFGPSGVEEAGSAAGGAPTPSRARGARKATAGRSSGTAAKKAAPAKKAAATRKAAAAKETAATRKAAAETTAGEKAAGRKASAQRSSAQKAAANKATAAKKAPAKKAAGRAASPAQESPATEVADVADGPEAPARPAVPLTPVPAPPTAVAPEPAERPTDVSHPDASPGEAPAEPPVRKPAARKVAAAATEPALPSTTARPVVSPGPVTDPVEVDPDAAEAVQPSEAAQPAEVADPAQAGQPAEDLPAERPVKKAAGASRARKAPGTAKKAPAKRAPRKSE